jgi:hypothetical protein
MPAWTEAAEAGVNAKRIQAKVLPRVAAEVAEAYRSTAESSLEEAAEALSAAECLVLNLHP